MTILGLHHITIVVANAQRTVDFYTRVLGQRLVKQTVNFGAPDSTIFTLVTSSVGPARRSPFSSGPARPRAIPALRAQTMLP